MFFSFQMPFGGLRPCTPIPFPELPSHSIPFLFHGCRRKSQLTKDSGTMAGASRFIITPLMV